MTKTRLQASAGLSTAVVSLAQMLELWREKKTPEASVDCGRNEAINQTGGSGRVNAVRHQPDAARKPTPTGISATAGCCGL